MRRRPVPSRSARRRLVALAALQGLLSCATPAPPRAPATVPAAAGASGPPTANREVAPGSSDRLGNGEPLVAPFSPGAATTVASPPAEEPTTAEPAGPAVSAGPPPPFRAPLPAPELPRAAPARRIADLSPAACRAELARSGLPVERDRRPTPGVATGTRVTGPFHGVRLVVPPRSSPYGVLDCRLALILGELAALLAEQGVVAVRIDNTYRPRAHLPGSRRPSQHNYALAADVTAFTLADGRTLEVERDWPAAIGAPACGPEAELGSETPEALELRNLVCAIAARGLFHHILTPNFDAAHANHLHLDIQRDNARGTIH